VPTHDAATLELVSLMALNLKREEVRTRTHATALGGSDSDAAAWPTTTNSLNPTNPMINAGQGSPKTSTRPTKTNAAEMPSRPGMGAETSECPMLPPTRPTSSARLARPLLRPSHRRVSNVSPALL
jgi:hypothetical protein